MTFRHRRIVLLIAALTGSWLTACGGRGPVEPTPRPRFTVRILHTGAMNPDWRHAGQQVVDRLETDFRADVEREFAATEEQAHDRMESWGRAEVDLVIATGPGLDRILLHLAPRFPNTAFVVDRGTVIGSNLARFEFITTGASYLGGVAAAMIGGDTVGLLSADGRPRDAAAENRFESGFHSRKAHGRVIKVSGIHGIQLLDDAGVSIAYDGERGPQPALLAAARSAGLCLIGTNPVAAENAPDVVVAVVAVDLPEAVRRIALDVVDDTFVGRVYGFDLGSGVVDLRLGPVLADDRELIDALDEARAAVNAGMVDIEAMGL